MLYFALMTHQQLVLMQHVYYLEFDATKATCADANGYLDGSVGDNLMVHGFMPLGWIT